MAETETATIPSIEGLDPQSETYVSDLEAGLEQIKVLGEGLLDDEHDYANSTHARLLKHFSAEGIEIEQVMTREFLPEIELQSIKYAKNVEGKAKARQVEDLRSKFEDENTFMERKFKAREKDIKRAIDGFNDAIVDLTTVDVLCDVDGPASEGHFFVVRKEGVYVAIMGDTLPHKINAKKTDIDPAEIGTTAFKGRFMDENKGANAYVVRNPSQLISPKVLVEIGFEVSKRKRDDEPSEAKPEDDGAESAYDSVSRGIEAVLPVPKLEELALYPFPAQDDKYYLEALEEGYRRAREAYEQLYEVYVGFHKEAEAPIGSILKSAGELRFKDKKEEYAVGDLLTSYTHNLLDYHTALKRSLRTAKRSVDDFKEALTDFITVERLSRDEVYRQIHFYIVSGNEVYEAEVDINTQDSSSLDIEPHKSNLGVEHVSGEAIGRLKEEAQQGKTHVHVITSQTTALTPKELYIYGFKVVASDTARILAEGLKKEGRYGGLVEALDGLINR